MTSLHTEEQIRFTVSRLVHHLDALGRLPASATSESTVD
jgi:hypothetical protein